MTMRTIFAALVSNYKNALTKRHRVRLAYVWYSELAIGVLLLIAALGFDFLAYRSLVAASPELPQEEIQKIITLDERAVKKAAETMAERAALLKSPTFPSLIQNPF